MLTDDGNDSILEEAFRLTHGPRQEDYGHPLDDYTRTAAMASALLAHKLKEPLTAEEAALFQCCLKLSRQVNRPKRDNMVDLAGYAWVSWACTEERARRAAAAGPVEGFPNAYSLSPEEAAERYCDAVKDPEPTAPLGRLQLACGCYGGCKGHGEAVVSGVHSAAIELAQGNYAAERAAPASLDEFRVFDVPAGDNSPNPAPWVVPRGPKDPSGKLYVEQELDPSYERAVSAEGGQGG